MSGAVYYTNLALNGLVEGLVIALAALAVTLVFAVARFPNAATGDFMTAGAYAGIGVQALGLGSSVWLSGLAAVAATMALAAVAYLAVFRRLLGRSLVAALLASIGVAFLVRSLLTFFIGHDQHVFQGVPITRAMNFGGVRVLPLDLYLGAAALVCLALVFAVLFLSPVGRRMRAVADDPDLARVSGIRVGRVMLTLWLLVGAVTAVGGMIVGIKTVVMPEMGWDLLLPAFAAAILGGVGSPTGAVLAGVLLGVAQELSTPFVGFSYKIALSFVVLVVILLVRPQGLFGRLERVR
ncbi:MAG TPA: branched-chain amino acid ABC transporter permease [Thermoleophilaceae bacterium]|nr:branched-chain amino acid ABC transporter permease [Thermoleophilaceae bacterium]